jgi:(p)ppGpp synthase/HD superfamily hydrolase
MVAGETREERIVGVLHDVFEDTDKTYDEVSAIFGEDVARDVALLTKELSERNDEYLARVMLSEVARRVKINDVRHNMEPDRMARLDSETRERLTKKYTVALNTLGGE